LADGRIEKKSKLRVFNPDSGIGAQKKGSDVEKLPLESIAIK
jgi:hypothetical protein